MRKEALNGIGRRMMIPSFPKQEEIEGRPIGSREFFPGYFGGRTFIIVLKQDRPRSGGKGAAA
ncbi:MAG: hypothetical protein ACJAQT_005058 [Akkermansiaceae bacterium]|jgi:hypothetical protein